MSTLRLVAAQSVTRICANPGCENEIQEHPRGGRPRRYCTETCKRARATKVRAARERMRQQREALSEQGVSVGLPPLADAAEVRRAVQSLEQLSEDLSEVGSRLRRETADWSRSIRQESPNLNVYPDRLVREAYSLHAGCKRALESAARRVGPVDEFDTIATTNIRWLNIVIELGRMLGVDWDDEPLPVVNVPQGVDDFGD